MLQGNIIDLLADLTVICRAMTKEGIEEKVIRHAVDIAFKDKEDNNNKIENEFEKELDKTLDKLIEMLEKHAK